MYIRDNELNQTKKLPQPNQVINLVFYVHGFDATFPILHELSSPVKIEA